MKVVLYARVSSEKQAEKDLSITAQLKALKKYAEDRHWQIEREFIDEAESARSANRPAFQEMITLAKNGHGRFDAILVWKLSRFARNREDSIIYKSLLRKYGIKVISINEQVDETPAGRLLEGIIEVVDEFYSLNLAQDAFRGMKENAGRGYRNGGTTPTGYRIKHIQDGAAKRSILELDPSYSPLVKRIFTLALEGHGAKEIVKVLNEEGLKTPKGQPWSKHSIYYILKNEIYTGVTVWNRLNQTEQIQAVRVSNTHPAIIDEVSFHKVQQLIASRNRNHIHPRAVASDYLLSGLLECGKCGYKMVGTPAQSSKYFYYSCQSSMVRGKKHCSAKMIRREKIDDFVVDRLREHLLTEENILELLHLTNEELFKGRSTSKEKLTALESQCKETQKRLDKLYAALETGTLALNDLAPRIKDLKKQLEALERQKLEVLQEVRNSTPYRICRKQIQFEIEDLKWLLKSGSLLEQKAFLRSFIRRIVLKDKEVSIEYTIPINKKDSKTESEVLSLVKNGGPSVT